MTLDTGQYVCHIAMIVDYLWTPACDTRYRLDKPGTMVETLISISNRFNHHNRGAYE